MNKKSFSPFACVHRTRLILTGLLLLLIGAITVTPGSAIARDPGSIREVQCPTQDPLHTPVWRNFQALVDREYTGGHAGKRLTGEALALAYGHALGRAALAQGDDPVHQEAVACLEFVLDQKYAGLLVAYGPTAEPRRRHLYDLVQSTAMGLNDELVAKHTGVTSRTPAYSVFGAATPWQPPQVTPQPVADGQHCATIKANNGWQAVAVPRGFNGVIQIEGNWNVHHGHARVGPEGYTGALGTRMDRQYPQFKYESALPFAALLMRNGPQGQVSWVQAREHMGIATGPDFQFRINDRDDALSDNDGDLTVCLSVGRHGLNGNVPPNTSPGPANAVACVDSYDNWRISEANRLTAQAEDMERLVDDCYSSKNYNQCWEAARLGQAALDHITQWFARTRDVPRHCLKCDMTSIRPMPSALGNRLDSLSYRLSRKGMGLIIGSGWRAQYADFEKEDLCVLNKPRRGDMSISPVHKDDCPKHCADAAPNCNYAYYNDKTRTCSWADDQSSPNLIALGWGSIWDLKSHKWLTPADFGSGTPLQGQTGKTPLSGGRVFVLEKVVFSKYQTPTDQCGAKMSCKREKKTYRGNRTLNGTEDEVYYSVSENSATYEYSEKFIDGGRVLSNISANFTFDAPPSRLRPGEILQLKMQGNATGFLDHRSLSRSFAYYIKQGGRNNYFDKTEVRLTSGELPIKDGKRNGQLSKTSTTAITVPTGARKELIIGGKFGPDPGLYVDWIYKEQ